MTGVSVSKRLVVLAAAGAPLIMVAWLAGLHVHLFVVYNLLLAGLFLLDYYFLAKPDTLMIRRVSGDVLYAGKDNDIFFHADNRSRWSLRLQATDDLQRHFTLTATHLQQNLPSYSSALFSYTVSPAKRGCFLGKHIDLRYTGVLGLCIRYATFPCPITCKVYPPLEDILRYRNIHRKVHTFKNPLVMNHCPGNTHPPVFILLDTGRSMGQTADGYTKLDYAVNAALVLSDTVNRQGGSSGLMVFDTVVHSHIIPGKGVAHRKRWLEALYRVEAEQGASDYQAAFRRLCEQQKRRALVFIFTGLADIKEAEPLITSLALLKKQHQPVVLFMNETKQAHTFPVLNKMRIPYIESIAPSFALTALNYYLCL